MMKFAVAVVVAGLLGAVPAGAQQMNADDMKWINQCISDNAGQPGATTEIVRTYCMCMDEKMDDNETRSITEWEKANPEVMKACDKQAGWR